MDRNTEVVKSKLERLWQYYEQSQLEQTVENSSIGLSPIYTHFRSSPTNKTADHTARLALNAAYKPPFLKEWDKWIHLVESEEKRLIKANKKLQAMILREHVLNGKTIQRILEENESAEQRICSRQWAYALYTKSIEAIKEAAQKRGYL